MSITCNLISTSSISCASFDNFTWTCLHDRNRQYHQHQWNEETDQITAPQYNDEGKEKDYRPDEMPVKVLKEKNCKKITNRYVHVPHRDKPPQVVAKRNARERKRVQAVNSAFVRLRKAVPLENNRGKRVSKVKTLQNAIKYIQKLQELLHWHEMYEDYVTNSYCFNPMDDFFEENFEGSF
ncbi:hypothetical protein Trydic_g21115 [Trypoxylus dichotomus]